MMDCADCDCCRPIMDESCLFFPELYRLYDQEVETGQKISADRAAAARRKVQLLRALPLPQHPGGYHPGEDPVHRTRRVEVRRARRRGRRAHRQTVRSLAGPGQPAAAQRSGRRHDQGGARHPP
ncbi:MAG: hypothetical protein MZV70_74710 [Desulfobacterales bacterium]|nr:hypothetical protein [Desulfobacterales bacterium]